MGIWDKHASSFDQAGVIDRTGRIDKVGLYRLKVCDHTFSVSQNKGGGKKRSTKGWTIFKCRYEVVATSHSDAAPVGATRVWFRMINPADEDQAAFQLSDIRGHLGAISGRAPETITSAMVGALEPTPRKFEGRTFIMEVRPARNPEYTEEVFYVDGPEWDARIKDLDAQGNPSKPQATAQAPAQASTQSSTQSSDWDDEEPVEADDKW